MDRVRFEVHAHGWVWCPTRGEVFAEDGTPSDLVGRAVSVRPASLRQAKTAAERHTVPGLPTSLTEAAERAADIAVYNEAQDRDRWERDLDDYAAAFPGSVATAVLELVASRWGDVTWTDRRFLGRAAAVAAKYADPAQGVGPSQVPGQLSMEVTA